MVKRSFLFGPLALSLLAGCGGGGGGSSAQPALAGKHYARLGGTVNNVGHLGSIQLDIDANNMVTFVPTYYRVPAGNTTPVLVSLPPMTSNLVKQPDGSYLSTVKIPGADYVLLVTPPQNGERGVQLTVSEGAEVGTFQGILQKGNIDDIGQTAKYDGDVALLIPPTAYKSEFWMSRLGDFVGRLEQKTDPTKFVLILGRRKADGTLDGFATSGGFSDPKPIGGTFNVTTNQLAMNMKIPPDNVVNIVGTLNKL